MFSENRWVVDNGAAKIDLVWKQIQPASSTAMAAIRQCHPNFSVRILYLEDSSLFGPLKTLNYSNLCLSICLSSKKARTLCRLLTLRPKKCPLRLRWMDKSRRSCLNLKKKLKSTAKMKGVASSISSLILGARRRRSISQTKNCKWSSPKNSSFPACSNSWIVTLRPKSIIKSS